MLALGATLTCTTGTSCGHHQESMQIRLQRRTSICRMEQLQYYSAKLQTDPAKASASRNICKSALSYRQVMSSEVNYLNAVWQVKVLQRSLQSFSNISVTRCAKRYHHEAPALHSGRRHPRLEHIFRLQRQRKFRLGMCAICDLFKRIGRQSATTAPVRVWPPLLRCNRY